MTYPVKWYSSEMQGAPEVTSGYTAADCGTLTAAIKACLVTGFGSTPVDSLVYDTDRGEAKLTIQSGHKFLAHQVIKVIGATDNTYNGEFRVTKATLTELWFKLASIPAGDAQGTITVSVPPAGWSVRDESADGHIAIFEAGADVGNIMLRIDNSPFDNPNGSNSSSSNNHGALGSSFRAIKARVQQVENVTSAEQFDQVTEHRWPASHIYGTPYWEVIADEQFFYLIFRFAEPNRKAIFFAGYINSIRPGDRYHFISNGLARWDVNSSSYRWNHESSGIYNDGLTFNKQHNEHFLARQYHQLLGTGEFTLASNMRYSGSLTRHPNPVDNGFYINDQPVIVLENGDTYRGSLPGVLTPQSGSVAFDGKTLDTIPELPATMLRCHALAVDAYSYDGPDGEQYKAYTHCFDISDAGWR
ncbi:hypothetical protein L1285_16870 [Pseudoalteromonas sp. DL2-H2.2]|uniref:hypothetical protein n=1 Tax=Pseudoalteromonas sp. DL2-H2.2 TaxID=2908889 RepID=UPI001F2631B9|nr:hypothetical protein [Pseudoalteromonas sp. DL2-H2.2]MCF2909995.1 hypothetical protein [Pseudoalteromonas sp. DL2-H2.2]